MIHARSDYDGIQDSSGKIPEDEPVFVLRACDALAPAAMMHWATLLEANGGSQAQAQAVRAHAMRMADYARTKGGHKLPDAPVDVLRF